MKYRSEIPSFVTSFVEAERFLTRQIDKPTDWLQGGYILFRSYEMLLRDILSSAEIEIVDRWTLGKLSQEVFSQANFPSSFKQDLTDIVQHRNMVAHSHPALNFSGEIFLDDLEKIRNLALWYLQEYTRGPRLSVEASLSLLKGEDFPLPKVVFISYAREDQDDANHLYNALYQRGHKPWMDKRDLIAGQEWESEIRKAIEKADYFVALMSSNSVTKRGFVQKEIRFALDVLGEIPPGRIYFIPARLEPCEVPDVIKRLQWVDLQKDDTFLQIFRAIEHD